MGKRISDDEMVEITQRLTASLTATSLDTRKAAVPEHLIQELEILIADIVTAYNTKGNPYRAIDKAKQQFIGSGGESMGRVNATIIANTVSDEIQELARGR